MKALKDKLVDAGPEIVMSISEDRDKAESRLRAANRRVSELEGIVLEMQRQLDQVEEENIKVTVSDCSCPVFVISNLCGTGLRPAVRMASPTQKGRPTATRPISFYV